MNSIQQQIADYNKQYQKTHIGYKAKDSIIPFSVDNVDYSNAYGKFFATGYMYIGKTYIPDRQELSELLFKMDMPDCGTVDINDITVYISRVPVRQWALGASPSVMNVRSAFYAEQQFFGIETVKGSGDLYYRWFNQKYVPVKEAIRMVTNGEVISKAISNKFYIGNKLFGKQPFLFYKDFTVGKIIDNAVELPYDVNHLADEIAQYLEVKVK